VRGDAPVSEQPIAQARALGASEDDIDALRQQLRQQQQASLVQVLPENWHAVSVFVSMSTQWIWDSGKRRGLQFASVPMARAEHRAGQFVVPLSKLMQQLRVLEGAALTAMEG
jgi:hypothetical protein